MQRKATKQSRGPNADEKRFQAWLKLQPCAVGGMGITEVHHCKGSAFKHNKVHIGHWFCLPLSQQQHSLYHAGTKAWQAEHGSQAAIWLSIHDMYTEQTGCAVPIDVYQSIASLA